MKAARNRGSQDGCFTSLKLLALTRRCCSFRLAWLEQRIHLLLSLLSLLALIGLVACDADSSPSPSDSGPLIVVDVGGGSDSLGGTAPVDIGDNCVTMEQSNGNLLLLVWHSAEGGWEVGWNDDEREITFSSPAEPETVTIRDGDIITVGGESWEPQDAAVMRDFEWIAAPHESCSGELFEVSSVSIE